MNNGFFYEFINDEIWKEFCKTNNIKKSCNIFFCIKYNNKNKIFNLLPSSIEYNEKYYVEFRLNNISYYINIEYCYEITDINSIKIFNGIKHGKLEKKILDKYVQIKEKRDSKVRKQEEIKENSGRVYELVSETNAIKYLDDKECKLSKIKDLLIIGNENNQYIVSRIFNQNNSQRIPIYQKNKEEIYGYINLNFCYKIPIEVLKVISDVKISTENIFEKLKEIKKEKSKNQKTEKTKLNNENDRILPEKINIKTLKNSEQKIKKKSLDLTKITVYIRKNNSACNIINHDVKECIGNVSLINSLANVINKEIIIFYCNTCRKYLMSELDYELLLRNGVPLCKIVNEVAKKNNYTSYSKMNDESELYCYGYNVNQIEGLTINQRRKILTLLIDNNLMTKEKIENHLSYLIRTRTNLKNFRYAIEKWKADREFILNYKTENLEVYSIDTLKRKVYY